MKILTRYLPIIMSFVCTVHAQYVQRPSLIPEENMLVQLQKAGLIQENKPIKLHLGCGKYHLTDYINIDYPPELYELELVTAADAYADVKQLNFLPNSLDEIRSHHMFEHFDRQTALALLCAWHTWLKPGGKLVIETPDFQACIEVIMNRALSYKERQVVIRHIFGSHEAQWAYHYDGWYKAKFEHVLSSLGFSELKFELINYYYLIPSILVTAQKKDFIHIQELAEKSKSILYDSVVSTHEQEIWHTWCKIFDEGLKNLHIRN